MIWSINSWLSVILGQSQLDFMSFPPAEINSSSKQSMENKLSSFSLVSLFYTQETVKSQKSLCLNSASGIQYHTHTHTLCVQGVLKSADLTAERLD